jgi:ribose 5-phosphate isomerase A
LTEARDAAAAAAVELVELGMTIGLGSGRALWKALDLLVERGDPVRCVVASSRTDELARQAGFTVLALDGTVELDLALDGADEVDPSLGLIKGGGGALLREKIVASASAGMIVIVDETKWVPVLGRFPLPVEVVPFGLAATRLALDQGTAAVGCSGPMVLRPGKDGHAFVTDGGHWILDAAFGRIADPRSLAERLDGIAGVVEHGLFVGLAHAVVIAGSDGVRVVERR